MTEAALNYLDSMDRAIGCQLLPGGAYEGREGHEKFARECGYALNDFCRADRKEIVPASYGKLYVKHCGQEPVLGAKEWASIMYAQVKEDGK